MDLRQIKARATIVVVKHKAQPNIISFIYQGLSMKTVDLSFEVISNTNASAKYTGGCSGDRSDCCTRVCTRAANDEQASESGIDAWEKYLEVNAGVLQY